MEKKYFTASKKSNWKTEPDSSTGAGGLFQLELTPVEMQMLLCLKLAKSWRKSYSRFLSWQVEVFKLIKISLRT